MKRVAPIALLVALLVGVATIDLSAQESGTNVVFIRSQAVIAAHPAGEDAATLERQAREELGEIQASIQQLAERAQAGEQLSAADQERYQTLITTFETVQRRYEADIMAAAEPAIEAVNSAITAVAENNDYAIILDAGVAGQSGTNLVVYSRPGLDVTDQVIEELNRQLGQ